MASSGGSIGPSEVPVQGPHFLEFRKKPSRDEFILGQWEMAGGEIIPNPSNSRILCSFCKEDSVSRRERQEMYGLPVRSYQVPGYTRQEDHWKWEKLVCNNPDACWGKLKSRNITRIFDIRRQTSTNEAFSKQYRFAFYNNSTVIDKFYVNVKQEPGRRFGWHINNGIAVKDRKPNFFNQVLFQDQPDRDIFYVYVEIHSREKVPDEFRNIPFKERPSYYQRREYVFPTYVNFDFYRKNSEISSHPQTWNDLMNNHVPLARVFLDVYSGGTGLAAHSWKYLKVVDEDEDTKYKWPKTVENSILLGYTKCPNPYWINSEEMNALDGNPYIPGYSDGYGGKLTTYWTRTLDRNQFYSN